MTMYPVFQALCSYLWWFWRPILKGFLRKTTRLCELQRVCYGERRGAPRTIAVEFSLRHSRVAEIQHAIERLNELAARCVFKEDTSHNAVEYTLGVVVEAKHIKLQVHHRFKTMLGTSLHQIFGYRQLLSEVEACRTTLFDTNNPLHEQKLAQLWGLLMPETTLEKRISKQWGEIGFQGEDPKTDFRGMGLLGLENLLFFAQEYTQAARHVLTHSQHPTYGYSFAIVGINLTSMAYQLLKGGHLKNHFFNSTPGSPVLKHFHHVYCYIFFEFDKTWLKEKPVNVMEFSRIRDVFEARLVTELASPNAICKMNMSVETL